MILGSLLYYEFIVLPCFDFDKYTENALKRLKEEQKDLETGKPDKQNEEDENKNLIEKDKDDKGNLNK